MKTTKFTAAAVSMALCAALFAGCGKSGNDNAQTVPTETAEQVTTAATEDNSVDPTVMVDLAAGVSEKMYSRAIMSEGNTDRLAAAMKKAESGEKVTVGVIGGSITQGSRATSQEKCYASLFFKWWSEKFPSGQLEFVNAGIGGTDSYLGVHRIDEQLLDKNPDVVIVEFSVNDTDKTMNKYSYDSLVRKILSRENMPAVILVFTTMDNGTSLQDVHKEIGKAYDLPMISYHDAVYPEVAAGTLVWSDISPDNIHPNDAGHDIIGQILSRYLDGVYNDRANAPDPVPFTTEGYTKDYYANATLLGSDDIAPVSADNFAAGGNNTYTQFPDNWSTENGGSITFEVECRNFGVLFLKTTDGKSGTYEVWVDGERKGKLEADFSGGWGTHGYGRQVVLANDTVKHTIEIKPAEGSEDKGLTILALMVS